MRSTTLRFRAIALVAISAACVGRGSSDGDAEVTNASQDQTTRPARDWKLHPAIVEIDGGRELFALSDPHGHYELLTKLLAQNHLIETETSDPSKVKWTGKTAVLVIAGDLIDKGPESLEVVDFVRALEASAAASGGRVVTTMGNHEAEFMLDPENHKATATGQDDIGIDHELAARNIDPKSVARTGDAAGRGAWIAALPFGIRVGKWFLSHAGNTSRLSLKDLDRKLRRSLDNNGFGDKDITGSDSILEAEKWYGDDGDDKAGRKEAAALGVDHIAFGHDPGAFGKQGSIRASKNGVLVKLDTAMGLHDGATVFRPFLLHVKTTNGDDAEVLDDAGHAAKLL